MLRCVPSLASVGERDHSQAIDTHKDKITESAVTPCPDASTGSRHSDNYKTDVEQMMRSMQALRSSKCLPFDNNMNRNIEETEKW